MSRHECFLVLEVDGGYQLPDGRIVHEPGIPPGGVWEIQPGNGAIPGPDGKCWMVKLPNGSPWSPDGVSGPHWSRDASPAPRLTVSPSIHATVESPSRGTLTTYHGFLTNGVLESTADSPC